MSKYVIITGATTGIGAAISEKFAKEGYNIIGTSRKTTESSLSFSKNIIEKYNINFELLNVELSNSNSIEVFIENVKKLNVSIDVLVNNAGITNDKLTQRMSEEDFVSVIDTNLTGTFLMCKHILKIMSKQKYGSIVNMSSIIGITGNIGQANYAASKAGIIGLTKSHAKEFGRKNIRVNAVAPGFIKTKMTDVLSDDLKNKMLENIDLKRLGTVEEVANLTYFLGSEEASYITGQTIVIDGGLS